MEFVILGPTALYVDEKPVHLGAAKQRGMLAILLYHIGQPVATDTIIEHLWADQAHGNHRPSLYALASRIRNILSRVGFPQSLVRVPGADSYRLDIDPLLIDFHRAQQIIAEARDAARHHRHEAAAARLTEAISLWRGEPLTDLRGAAAEHLRRRLNDLFLDANKLLARSQLHIGEHHAALLLLEPLIHHHVFDEGLAQHWTSALWRAGREDEARSFLATFRRRYRREFRTDPSIGLPPDTPGARPAAGAVPGAAPAADRGRHAPPPTRPCQLPRDVNDFTGHRGLLAKLDALTAPGSGATNVVVISGMPGAGKTTLAVHWAHQHRSRYPDGQLYVNACAYGPTPPVDPDDALVSFLRAFDIPPDRIPLTREQRRDRLNQLLDGRRLLVVLDNVQDSDQARPLIPTSDSCVTLITSRTRLRGLTIRDGARGLTVPPLPEADCMALLRRLVGAARLDAEPSEARTLARLSGGLPLAVRIIGEHVAERPKARIADLVNDLSGHLLDAEGDDGDDNDLRTVFAWSYDALAADTAALFRLLGLHPGPSVSPELAAALADTPVPRAEHLLNVLAKAHLVNHDTARRYRFHDLVRRYAADRAHHATADDDRRAAMTRLLDWYLLSAANAVREVAPHRPTVPDLPQATSVRPLTFDTDLDALRWCEAERANLAAVAQWAAGNGFHRYAWQIPGVIHEVVVRSGRQDDVRRLLELALTAARADDHRIGQIGTLNNLGVTHFTFHDLRRAAESFQASLWLADQEGYTDAQTVCSHNLASIHLATGDAETAIRIYQDVLVTCRATSNQQGEAATLHRLGAAHRQTRQYDRALTLYLQALAIREQVGSLRGQGTTHGEIAALYLQTGRPQLALDHCRRALEFHDRTRDDAARCDALIVAADAQRELALYHDALRNGRLAVDLSDTIADSQRRCHALTVLAHTILAAGDRRTAGYVCEEALSIAEDLHHSTLVPLRSRLVRIRAACRNDRDGRDEPFGP